MGTKSDQILLQLIKKDDQAALEALFEKYYYRLSDFAFQYVRSFDLTEEVVSDVFLKIWNNRHGLMVSVNFKSYIYTATRNQALNYLKKENRDLEPLDVLTETSSDRHQPDEELEFQEFQNQIERLINILPPRRKIIFKLSRIEGFTYREIAKILSISEHTVQNQMIQAVKQLASYSRVK